MTEESLFEEFKARYAFLANKAVSYRKTGRFELTAELNDGTRVIYNAANQTFGTVRNADQITNLDAVEWRDEFSRRLRRLVTQSMMTEDEISEMAGISRATLSRYLNGRSAPDPYNMLRLARALGCSVGYLACEE